jgi:hypothetical protein
MIPKGVPRALQLALLSAVIAVIAIIEGLVAWTCSLSNANGVLVYWFRSKDNSLNEITLHANSHVSPTRDAHFYFLITCTPHCCVAALYVSRREENVHG